MVTWLKRFLGIGPQRFGASGGATFSDDQAAPPSNAFVPAKSDATNDPNGPFLWLYVGGAGDVKLHTVGGQDVTFSAVAAGTILWIQHTRIWSTGTAASNLMCTR